MQTLWQRFFEGRQAQIPPGVLAGYDHAFRDELVRVIQRTRDPALRAKLVEMLDCPIRDSRGQCRSFSDYIVSALIKNGIHQRYDLEAALGYVAEKMLMDRGEDGSPRTTVFGGFTERPDYEGGNPLQARFMKYLQFAVNNIRRDKIPRLASVEARPQGTVSIGQGRRKKGDLYVGVSPDEIAARPSSERDLDDLVGDIQTLLRQKERTYNLPLVDIFHAIMAGERSDDQRRRFGDRTTRMGRKAIVSTIRSYAESTGNYALLNLLQKFEDPQPNMPTPARRQAVKVVRPVLSDKERDYASILSVIDRLGRPAGSADLGRFRRRWLEYPPRDPTSSHRNRLEEVLAAMTRDGVLRATRTAAGAFVYTPGQNADQYRGAGGAAPAMSSNAL